MYVLPKKPGAPLRLEDVQTEPVTADVFFGEPGASAPRYESDFCPTKLRCDVILNGSAYAPSRKPITQVTVGIRVGGWTKGFDVIGNRQWERTLGLLKPSAPEPFYNLPIGYHCAYGGIDRSETYLENPTGVGYYPKSPKNLIEGRPLPNTQGLGEGPPKVKDKVRPWSFGPIGRNWSPRFQRAGTYNDAWVEDGFPHLPKDFDPAYYQAAPADQQIPYPQGGEEIILSHLSKQGRLNFRLPDALPIEVEVTTVWTREKTWAVVDTLILEPDDERLFLTWRASVPLRRNMLEVRQVVVGTMPTGWHRARALGKRYVYRRAWMESP